MSLAECGKGWTGRCAAAKSKKCRCRCGGENHGKARPTFVINVAPDEITEVLAMVVETTIRPLPFTPRIIERYDYEGFFSKGAQTHLTICGKVIIATERDDNPGASITNAAENLWAKVRAEFGDDIIAIEHYPKGRVVREDWDLVTIVDGEAQWSPVSRETLAALIANPASLETVHGVAVVGVA